ncbi:MAG: hypothetical protein IJ124_11265 [Clostridia bacterium]|nr:hypothetical protein [Clostridia bacterium]
MRRHGLEIPASATAISDDAFQGAGPPILFGQSGSAAAALAASHGPGFAAQ